MQVPSTDCSVLDFPLIGIGTCTCNGNGSIGRVQAYL